MHALTQGHAYGLADEVVGGMPKVDALHVQRKGAENLCRKSSLLQQNAEVWKKLHSFDEVIMSWGFPTPVGLRRECLSKGEYQKKMDEP